MKVQSFNLELDQLILLVCTCSFLFALPRCIMATQELPGIPHPLPTGMICTQQLPDVSAHPLSSCVMATQQLRDSPTHSLPSCVMITQQLPVFLLIL